MSDRLRILTFIACAVACSAPPRAGTQRASARQEVARSSVLPPLYDSLMDTSRWVAWRTSALVLRHPAGATQVPDTDRFSGFVGTSLRWDFTDNRWLALAIAQVPATSAPSLKDFVDSVRHARNANLNPNWRLAPPTRVVVSHYPALEMRPDCGDCVAYEFYVQLPRTWLVISFSLEQSVPYTYEEQEQLYRRIIATLEGEPRN